jgi:ubiquinone/menaquinone biosynthesis C-methylase UbiE
MEDGCTVIKWLMGVLIRAWRKPQGVFAPLFLGTMNLGHLPFIKKVLSEVSIGPSDRILDVGCGGGNAVCVMARSGAKVYGIDHSPACVEKAARTNRRRIESGQVSICEGDAGKLPFEDNMFDLITAFETIYFWPNIESAFREIRRKLVPSGIFLVACETRAPEGGKHFLEDVDSGKEPFHIYSCGEIRGLLEKAGFTDIKELLPQKPRWLCLSAQKAGAIGCNTAKSRS